LESLVRLQEVVKAEHEFIVNRALGFTRIEQAEQPFAQLLYDSRSLAVRQPRRGAEAREQLGEWLRSGPNTRIGQVDVREHAQNPPASGRSIRKGIDVQQVVPCLEPQPARRFLHGSKADAIKLPRLGVARQG